MKNPTHTRLTSLYVSRFMTKKHLPVYLDAKNILLLQCCCYNLFYLRVIRYFLMGVVHTLNLYTNQCTKLKLTML